MCLVFALTFPLCRACMVSILLILTEVSLRYLHFHTWAFRETTVWKARVACVVENVVVHETQRLHTSRVMAGERPMQPLMKNRFENVWTTHKETANFHP